MISVAKPLDRERLFGVWGRSLRLSGPVMAEELFNTLMRTTDIIITALFSPAAVAAVGLADLYGQLSLRFGLGLGGGAIALCSQDTGSGAIANRNEGITQSIIIGGLTGLPLVVFGLLFGRPAIAVLGASPEVARLGGTYLAIVLAASPAYIIGMVGNRALQGIGDTRTPMVINISANALNIAGSVVLGLGLFGFPQLGIIGVGASTATANVLTACAVLVTIGWLKPDVSFVWPRSFVITRQLIDVSVPEFAAGIVTTLVSFPFNALLLTFGTDLTAAYHIGNRLYQQVAGPLYRAYDTVTSIILGQTLGRGDSEGARFEARALLILAVVTLSIVGAALFFGAGFLVSAFTSDPETTRYAVGFARTFGAVMPFVAVFFVLSGVHRSAGATRTLFLARVTGWVLVFLGLSYFVAVTLGYGVLGIYAGIGLSYVWMALFLGIRYRADDWTARSAALLSERENIPK